MINTKVNRLYLFLLCIVIVFIDQFTKYIITINYKSIINNNYLLFTVDYIKNYGAAFNILDGSIIFLSLVSIFISILLVYLLLAKKNLDNITLYSYSFILGGTIGNGIDRILKGYVIDFINLNFIDFPVFNVADISINIGFILILYSFLKNKK